MPKGYLSENVFSVIFVCASKSFVSVEHRMISKKMKRY